MTVIEFRADDSRAGVCPVCGRQVRDHHADGKGYCPVHGMVFMDYPAAHTESFNEKVDRLMACDGLDRDEAEAVAGGDWPGAA